MAEKSSVTSDNNNTTKSPHLAFTTISNIKLHIPVQLRISEPNYKKWSRLFRLLVLCFNLMGFLDGTNVASSADDVECLSINEYFHLLKNLADYLDDVDAPVTEHALVLQVLQGLPQDIRSQVHFLQYQNPFPSFLEFRSALLLVEQQQADTFSSAGSSTALAAAAASRPAVGSRGMQAAAVAYRALDRAPMVVKTGAATEAIADVDVDAAPTNDNPSAQTLGSSLPPHPAYWALGPLPLTQPRPTSITTHTL
ncbi:unnamed protein product [Cuscuta campestris]|uniref:Retrotransposon Copia-like N-terminal domain-containing protein n=1 Tax=Cuscuta campestris TaxID=132261 RepID=A0A484NJT8_9ASTE|nr:unnamed protein product [Cuscuta campestris]